MSKYPHLKLPFKLAGQSKVRFGGGGKKNALVEENKANRANHGNRLLSDSNKVLKEWETMLERRPNELQLFNSNDIPLFLKVDRELNLETLENWGITFISEESDGYIIGASTDKLAGLNQRLEEFLSETGRYKDTAAKLFEISTDSNWRLSRLLDSELLEKWETIDLNSTYDVEVEVSCYLPFNKEYPKPINFDSQDKFDAAVNEFNVKKREHQIQRGELELEREMELDNYLTLYGGEKIAQWENESDAIAFKIRVSGSCLKDITLTYQYVFRISLSKELCGETGHIINDFPLNFKLISPEQTAPTVCVIDSGIQEEHVFLSATIKHKDSKNYVDDSDSVMDYVRQSGHGTKVAGAIIYTSSIQTEGQYQSPIWIQNARILDSSNKISDQKFGPALIKEIIDDFEETRIFNLSVSEKVRYAGTHMSPLAQSIDKACHENDRLFVISMGNIPMKEGTVGNPSVEEYLQSGINYPDYLDDDRSGISNPGISMFSLTVGSIAAIDYEDEDYISISSQGFLSAFSRSGLGMWDSIKPDVVEKGGDYVRHKTTNVVVQRDECSVQLLNSTIHGASAIGFDNGTSFSAPKVAHIAALLSQNLPNEKASMYKALIIHSARLPEHCWMSPTTSDFRKYGYGIPSLERAVNNNPGRITFIQSGIVQPKMADVYHLVIPQELRGEGKNFNLLIEVTLTFTSNTRSTRKGAHQYLAGWVEWRSSKYNEPLSTFRQRTVSILEEGESEEDQQQDHDSIKWVLRENKNWSPGIEISRNNSTAQKSWTILQPHQFAEEFGISIIGHQGWEKDISIGIPYSLCVSFEVLDAEMDIYNIMSEAQVVIEPEIEL